MLAVVLLNTEHEKGLKLLHELQQEPPTMPIFNF